MASPQPVVVIIQGAWQTIEHYEGLIGKLRTAGFQTEFPPLPSTNNHVPPTKSLPDDVAFVRGTITRLADAGHPIIVLMHSYGGTVGGDATAGLAWTERRGRGGIVHLVYMAAFVIPAGNSMVTPFGGAIPPWLDEDKEKGTIRFKDPRNGFFSDLSLEQQDKWLGKLVACPTSVLTTSVENGPYNPETLKSTYIVCKGDPTLTTQIQEGIAQQLGQGTTLEYTEAGHCAQLGAPDRVVDIIKSVWAKAKPEAM